jgi:hypothetical protein
MPKAPRWATGGAWCDQSIPRDTNMSYDQYLAYIKSGGTCRDYEGQQDGHWVFNSDGTGAANAPAPAFGREARTDVEGCCWWGRGVIQTTGVCNFGKLNYFMGARAANEGRNSLFPSVDFCNDPQAICSSKQHPELKWIAGLFYYQSEVQPWDSEGFNYQQEVIEYVEQGMTPAAGKSLVDKVSGIVNRGCPKLNGCPAGPVDGASEREENFNTVLAAMGLK